MKRDFTLNVYNSLIDSFKEQGYSFINFNNYLTAGKPKKYIIMRHDVDKYPLNALEFARLEHSCGISATYYFRIIEDVFDKEIIRKIFGLGHEIGYHYEDFASAKGNLKEALCSFKLNLERIRNICPVTTICMHGSPLSKWDNREMWKNNSYRSYGIIGEPYFDINFKELLYLTDTGRGWNKSGVSLRDKIGETNVQYFKNTFDLKRKISLGTLNDKIMINTHPQRWTDSFFPWMKELVWQNLKNAVKILVKR